MDNLYAILAAIRAEMPEVPDASWDKLRRLIGTHAAGTRVYVAAEPKRSRLELLAELGAEADAQQIARTLGVSVRRAQQLKRIKWG